MTNFILWHFVLLLKSLVHLKSHEKSLMLCRLPIFPKCYNTTANCWPITFKKSLFTKCRVTIGVWVATELKTEDFLSLIIFPVFQQLSRIIMAFEKTHAPTWGTIRNKQSLWQAGYVPHGEPASGYSGLWQSLPAFLQPGIHLWNIWKCSRSTLLLLIIVNSIALICLSMLHTTTQSLSVNLKVVNIVINFFQRRHSKQIYFISLIEKLKVQ